MKTLTLITIYFIASIVFSQTVSAQVKPKQMIPIWWQVIPLDKAKLKPGDKVFMLTNLEGDPFNGLYTIDKNGTVLPKFCKQRIKISGLTEIEASATVRKHAGEQKVYNVKSAIKLYVANANRFPKFFPNKKN